MPRKIPSLKRGKPTRNPAVKFTVFCEGANTEPSYLKALQALQNRALVEIRAEAPAGVPYTLAEAAKAYKKSIAKGNANRDSFSKDDQIWAMFDRDEHPRYAEAISLCESNGIFVARSNPCFELWLILHLEDYDKPSDRHAVQKHLAEIHKPYESSKAKTAECNELLAHLKDAETRALAQINRREAERASHLSPPYTTVFKLTSAIRLASDKMGKKIKISQPKG